MEENLHIRILIDQYLEYIKYEKLSSPSTVNVRFYELRLFREYMEQEFAVNELQEVKMHQLRNYITHLHGAGYQPVSLANTISTLRALYDFALDRGAITTDLAQRLKKPQVDKKEVEHFTWEEVESLFLAVLPGGNYLRDLCLLLILYYCGLRVEELSRIRKSDLNDDFSELYVEKGKGDKSRLLPVHPFLQRTLRLYMETGLKENMKISASPFLFPGKSNGPLSKDRIYRIVRECGARTGIEKRVSPHIFRHSFVTHLHQKGVDINCLAQLLGHVNIEKTAVYTHIEDDVLTEAVLKLKEDGVVWRIRLK